MFLLHIAYKNVFSCLWTRKCFFKLDFPENPLLQNSQVKGLSLTCIWRWYFKWDFWENPLLHTSQVNRFFWVSVRKDISALVFWAMSFEHIFEILLSWIMWQCKIKLNYLKNNKLVSSQLTCVINNNFYLLARIT